MNSFMLRLYNLLIALINKAKRQAEYFQVLNLHDAELNEALHKVSGCGLSISPATGNFNLGKLNLSMFIIIRHC
jgi:hypothetical protein